MHPAHHLRLVADRLADRSVAKAQAELEHLLLQYELLRAAGRPPLDAFATVATAPSSKKRLIEKKHERMQRDEALAKRRKSSSAWRTLDRYASELLHLHRTAGFGSRRLEEFLYKTHRKKVSYRTIARWLKERA